MDESRRSFLKQMGLAALGAGAGIPLLDPRAQTVWKAGENPASGRQWAMVVDVEKCLRDEVRTACAEACRREHNVPVIPDPEERIDWIWTEELRHALPDQVHQHTPAPVAEAPVLVLCNHCTDPPCTRVCPTGATWKRPEDGIVMMDMHRCIGCRYCMAACPYGARSFNWRDPRDYVEKDGAGQPLSDYPTRTRGVVEKCTFCASRIRDGRPPACVEALGGVAGAEGALTFGDVTDPDSEVSRILSERTAVQRREELGTGPNVYYLLPADLPSRLDAAGEEGEA